MWLGKVELAKGFICFMLDMLAVAIVIFSTGTNLKSTKSEASSWNVRKV